MSTRATVVVPFAFNPVGRTPPFNPCTVVHWDGLDTHNDDDGELGRVQVATRSTSGWDRTVPLTRTSIFGIV